MSFTKNNKTICDSCGLFCVPFDQEIPFGCKDYGNPEPLDPYHYCKKCSNEIDEEWLKKLEDKRNWRDGYWEKSISEQKAAKKLGLIWINSNGVGILGSKIWRDSYQYIPKKEYEELKALPYWGYCKLCGEPNKGGGCANQKCFDRQQRFNIPVTPKSPLIVIEDLNK